jgi:hypothetical protein
MTEKKQKRMTRKAVAVVYTNGKNKTYATLCHPSQKDTKTETDGGPFELLGRFQDKGYAFGNLKEDVPEWAQEKISIKNPSFVGCCVISNFPWV